MTVCQCRKGSGLLNGSWPHVRNHEILLVQVIVVSVLVRSFTRQKISKTKLAKQCGRQASKLKTWSFEMFLKRRHLPPIFHYAVNFIGRGQSGKFKAWFYGNYFFDLNTFLDVIEIPKPKNKFWPYGHFKYLYFKKGQVKSILCHRIMIRRLRCNVWQSSRKVFISLTYWDFQIESIPYGNFFIQSQSRNDFFHT